LGVEGLSLLLVEVSLFLELVHFMSEQSVLLRGLIQLLSQVLDYVDGGISVGIGHLVAALLEFILEGGDLDFCLLQLQVDLLLLLESSHAILADLGGQPRQSALYLDVLFLLLEGLLLEVDDLVRLLSLGLQVVHLQG